jgi:hypothetical protein
MTEPHRLELSDSEVIVLDALLDELTGRPDFETLIPHEADRQALHSLVCLLERINPTVLADNYDQQLARARRHLLGQP